MDKRTKEFKNSRIVLTCLRCNRSWTDVVIPNTCPFCKDGKDIVVDNRYSATNNYITK
jgi:rubrerythrin